MGGTRHMAHPLGSYELTALPLDYAAMMNAAGVIVGAVDGQAALYRDGAVTLLPPKSGYSDQHALAISNDNDLIVGVGTSAGDRRGLFWSSPTATPQDMGSQGDALYPYAINSSGVVVGYYDGPAGPTAFTWTSEHGYTDIAPDGTFQSYAEDISESGYVAGWMTYTGDNTPLAVHWDPAGGETVLGVGFGTDAFEDGRVLGRTGSFTGAVVWSGANAAVPYGPEPMYHVVTAVSAAGRLVGNRMYAPGPDGPLVAGEARSETGWAAVSPIRSAPLPRPIGRARRPRFGWPNPFPQVLPNRAWTVRHGEPLVHLPMPSGGVDSYAYDVSAAGAVFGSVTYSLSDQRPVIWTKLIVDVEPPIVAV